MGGQICWVGTIPKCLSEEVGQDASLAWSLACHPIGWIQWWTVLLGIGKSSPGSECGTGDLPERYPSFALILIGWHFSGPKEWQPNPVPA